jgi:hypothetical protein
MINKKLDKIIPFSIETKIFIRDNTLNFYMDKKRVLMNKTDRTKFFGLLKSKFGSLKNIRNKLKLPKTSFENYKNGKYTIPFELYSRLISFLPENEKTYFNSNISIISEDWGRSKGGKITYNKHKEIFDNGRRIAIMKIMSNPKYNFDINIPLNEKICEFIGAFIGDGFTNKYGSSYLIQFTGDGRYDKDYYINNICKILKENFNIDSVLYSRENTIRVSFYSKRLFEFLIKRLKFNPGKKVYTVKIPDEILNSNKKYITATLRGIFDTDSCIFFDKRASYKKPYIRINLTSASHELIRQVYNLLNKFELNPRMSNNYNKKVIQINGYINFKRFLKEIGFSNKRHLDKVKNL